MQIFLLTGIGVGYVPQELSLFLEFTIEESLIYFGKLYGLSSEELDTRIDFLLKFLELPERSRLLSHLSDGQRRRVSLSVALIHSPPLLILDEPTVGVDPLLRTAIWEHLESLSKNESITVIITTHYIEEARNAAQIGFIRYGQVLIEDTPKHLLKKYNTNSLEDVFLEICHRVDKDGEEKQFLKALEHCGCDQYDREKVIKLHEQNDHIVKLDKHFLFYKHWALFFKNWIKLRGNLTLLFWVLLLPSIELTLFLMITGPQHGLRVSVFNEEMPSNLSKVFLDLVDSKTIIQIPHKSLDSAINSVVLGSSSAAISFAANYTDALTDRIEYNMFANLSDNSDSLKVHIDMSNIMIGPKIFETLRNAMKKFLQNYFIENGGNPRIAEIPLVYDYVYGRYDPTFAEYALPGLMAFVMFYAPLKLCTFSMLKEREEGLLERSLVAGVSAVDYLISHILLQFFSLIIQIIVYSFTVFVIWNLEVKGNAFLFVMVLFFHGFTSIAFGMFISSIVSSEAAAMVIRIGVLLPSFFFSGIIWPTESYSPFMRALSLISPLTLPAEALRSIMTRGWSLSYYPVWIGIVSNCLHSIIYLTIAIFSSKLTIYS